MGEIVEQALYVVTSTPGPNVQFVELENADGGRAETQVPYERYRDDLWRLGPLYPLAYLDRLQAQLADQAERVGYWQRNAEPSGELVNEVIEVARDAWVILRALSQAVRWELEPSVLAEVTRVADRLELALARLNASPQETRQQAAEVSHG